MSNNFPLVSVCMITYNHDKFISKAIEGVLMQEVDFEIELVIADDASTDRTNEIIQSYIDSHPRGSWINYTSHPVNIGMMGNFFWALEKCQGEFIALCDGDDYWIESKKIKIQIDFLMQNKRNISTFHDSILVDNKGQLISTSFLPLSSKKNLNLEDIVNGKIIPTASLVFRKSAIPIKFPEVLLKSSNGDFILFFFLTNSGKSFYIENSKFSAYRIHNGGVWSTLKNEERLKKALDTFLILIQISGKFTQILLFNRVAKIYYELWKISPNKFNVFFIFNYSIKGLNFKIPLLIIYRLIFKPFL